MYSRKSVGPLMEVVLLDPRVYPSCIWVQLLLIQVNQEKHNSQCICSFSYIKEVSIQISF